MVGSVSSVGYMLSLLILASVYNHDDDDEHNDHGDAQSPSSHHHLTPDPQRGLQLALRIAEITCTMMNCVAKDTRRRYARTKYSGYYWYRACSVEGMNCILAKCLQSRGGGGGGCGDGNSWASRNSEFLEAVNSIAKPAARQSDVSTANQLFAILSNGDAAAAAADDDDDDDDDAMLTASYAHKLFAAASTTMVLQGYLGGNLNGSDDDDDDDSKTYGHTDGIASLMAAAYDCCSLLVSVTAKVSEANCSASAVPPATQLQDIPENGVTLIAHIDGHPTHVVVQRTAGTGLDQAIHVRVSNNPQQKAREKRDYVLGLDHLYFSIDGFDPSFKMNNAELRRLALSSLKSLDMWRKTPLFHKEHAVQWDSARDRVHSKVAEFLESAPLMADVGTCSICSDRSLGGLVKVATFNGGEHFQTSKCSCTFCSDCIQHWIQSKVSDFTSCIPCPGPECGYTLYSEDVRHHASHRVYGQYRKLFEHDHRARLLEIAGLRGDGAGAGAAGVSAGTSAVDASSLHQMLEQARCCPHCYVLVERSSGCSDMLCTCGQRFKWDDPKCKISVCIEQLLKEEEADKKKAASQAAANGDGGGGGGGGGSAGAGAGDGSGDAYSFLRNPKITVAYLEQAFGLRLFYNRA